MFFPLTVTVTEISVNANDNNNGNICETVKQVKSKKFIVTKGTHWTLKSYLIR